MTDLSPFAELVPLDHGLCVFSTVRAAGTVQSSVVNAGVMQNPIGAGEVVGFVAAGGSRKLENLRARPHATIVVRAGWHWAAVEGDTTLVGPDDPHPGIDTDALRVLLQEVFRGAGGTHDDWDVFDRWMAEERRTAVLMSPRRVYTNQR